MDTDKREQTFEFLVLLGLYTQNISTDKAAEVLGIEPSAVDAWYQPQITFWRGFIDGWLFQSGFVKAGPPLPPRNS